MNLYSRSRSWALKNMKSAASLVDLPARSEVLEKLEALAYGHSSPDEISCWAAAWLLIDQTSGTELRIVDWPVWRAINSMAGADLQVRPGVYLHGTDDFRAWLAELQSKPLPEKGG
jgi:hypothetical protein